jgi:hypothetical protein
MNEHPLKNIKSPSLTGNKARFNQTMKQIMALLLLASLGALLTMFFLPPIPIRRTPFANRPRQRHDRDWITEPIIGYPSPSYITKQKRIQPTTADNTANN